LSRRPQLRLAAAAGSAYLLRGPQG